VANPVLASPESIAGWLELAFSRGGDIAEHRVSVLDVPFIAWDATRERHANAMAAIWRRSFEGRVGNACVTDRADARWGPQVPGATLMRRCCKAL
jgi:hypothetical protein